MTQADFRLAEALGHGIGDKRLDILRRIGETGSISSAARAAGVSYKAAWQAIDTLVNLAGTPLVETAVGGSGGGGARLTEAGHWLLEVAARLDAARAAVLAEFDRRRPVDAEDPGQHPGRRRHADPSERPRAAALPVAPTTMAALGLRTSLRNQLPCRVAAVQSRGPLVRVTMTLADGGTLASRITRESAELLELRSGLPVLALCKATAVTITAPDPRHEPEAPDRGNRSAPHAGNEGDKGNQGGKGNESVNRLPGTVVRTARAASGSAEVALALGSGVRLVGFADAALRLKPARSAQATFDETSVVIGSVLT